MFSMCVKQQTNIRPEDSHSPHFSSSRQIAFFASHSFARLRTIVTFARIYIHIYIYICMYIYIYIHTYTHPYIYTHIQLHVFTITIVTVRPSRSRPRLNGTDSILHHTTVMRNGNILCRFVNQNRFLRADCRFAERIVRSFC